MRYDRQMTLVLALAVLSIGASRCSDSPPRADTKPSRPLCGLCYSHCCCSGLDSECGPGYFCWLDGFCEQGQRDLGPDHARPICGFCYSPPCCCSGLDSECGPGYYCYRDGLCNPGTRDGGRPREAGARERGPGDLQRDLLPRQ